MKPFLQNHLRMLLLLVTGICVSGVSAQNTLSVISSGQTGVSGTNWSLSGNILTVSGGAASIQASVITNHLESTGSLIIVASGEIIIDQDILPALNTIRTLTLKTNGDITLTGSRAITATGSSLNLVCWSDADGTGGGMIHCKPGSRITTNGGHLWMAGGSGSTIWNGLTVGNGYARAKTVLSVSQIQQLNNQSQDYQNAITIDNSSISSGGGNIYLAGESSGESVAYGHIGVLVQRGSSIISDAGSISLTGISASVRNASGWFWGILLASDRSTEPNTIRSTSGGISLVGESITSYNFNHSGGVGIFEWLVGTLGINEISSVSGAVTIDGNNKNVSNTSYGGLVFSGGGSGSRRVYSQTGNITFIGRSANASLNGIAISGGINVGYDGVNTCSGNIGIRTNRLAALPAAARFQSTGELSLEPLTASTVIGIGGATGTLALPATYFSTNFVDGFSRIVIGNSTQTGNISVATVSFNDDISLQTSGAVTQTGAITAAAQQLDLERGSFALTNTSNNVSKLSGNATAISFINNAALELKNIAATGTISIRTPAHGITISGNIASQSTSATAMVIAAGSGSTAGTIAGGDITVTGTPALSAGTGGSIRLHSGTLAGSSGLYQLVSTQIGKVRYNTDINTSVFNPVLTSGINILLRENGAVWTGSTTDYNTGTNWRDAAVPATGANIIIDPSATADLVLDASRIIGDLHFNGSNRKIILGNFDLTVNGVLYDVNATNYIRTNGAGQLRKTLVNNATFSFATGNSSFNPVTITNRTGSTDEFRVRVLDDVYMNGYSGTPVSGKYVKRTWDIGKANANGGSGIDLLFNWNSDEINSSFSSAALYHYASGWQKQTGSTSFTSNTLTYQGYTGSFSPFVVGDAAVVLPVTWMDFTAKLEQGAVVLDWRTAMEERAVHYRVQHGTDAQNWKDLGTIAATGNAQLESRYSYLHKQPAAGMNYYRLYQVDADGSGSFSKTISIHIASIISELKIYPNPVVNGSVALTLASTGSVQFLNAAGSVIMEKQLNKGSHVISLANLAKGIYFIRAGQATKVFIIR
ncbi:T9SS type A sorting domain-containing protein [Terrimonas sp. NA20]|uniref:T9SS type A sorting domain-containing protein n=1 Tax=Terrimonas ginsenosidimutans TaxID=2908004 RepID=A0ABS9KVG0_9BACT|nr:T9SS type A sorting domain-containing protein [Terrimonas ginsenosidimutans]MCG2616262.1 T9SS type A sorting domain-containing protein [Terrimonas ginsenosidimutans]